MRQPVPVGLLDSGVSGAVSGAVAAARAFALNSDGAVAKRPAASDALGHGTNLARIILETAPQVSLIVAQVFHASFATAPAIVAAGLSWLVGQGVRVINMSFGIRADRAVLREACAAACRAGVVLVAAAPARGPAVFPGAYPGVLRISGDARCRPGELSDLLGLRADFGACPLGPDAARLGDPVGGASFATAHAAGMIANRLAEFPDADRIAIVDHLRRLARYHGPERRTGNDTRGH